MANCPVCGVEVIECTACSGSGTLPGPAGVAEKCGNCGGKGFVDATTRLPDGCHE